jgi:hypothetical protein
MEKERRCIGPHSQDDQRGWPDASDPGPTSGSGAYTRNPSSEMVQDNGISPPSHMAISGMNSIAGRFEATSSYHSKCSW